ncbi:hypothetical protein [Brevibacillus agri]|uniref:hypothetical protein n=1 Tax=Brevibacillus agri TaxID=51101 RepID=UPI0018CCDDDF|nr:hypothetical protein [Brevibacillus agri]MBG9567522.1 hypothetical protein [Brevibacillus agri]MDN4091629.1 hypothetical protein [Brevibacillus agri]MDR9504560.1 hypothetical protein [Brevibacillus agri]MED3500226.1 hypothetical protein [Brevibacillus agri]WHX30432.1 hypothetical protein QNK09_25875 [Brevibacillus agri]
MDNLFVWLFLGPFMYSIELGGPIIGLIVTGYMWAVFGFRGWPTFGAAFLTSFLYYMIAVPSSTMLGSLLIIKAAMAVHSALLLTLIMWLFDKVMKRYRRKQAAGNEPLEK